MFVELRFKVAKTLWSACGGVDSPVHQCRAPSHTPQDSAYASNFIVSLEYAQSPTAMGHSIVYTYQKFKYEHLRRKEDLKDQKNIFCQANTNYIE